MMLLPTVAASFCNVSKSIRFTGSSTNKSEAVYKDTIRN